METDEHIETVWQLARRLAKDAYADIFKVLGTTEAAVWIFTIAVPLVSTVAVAKYNAYKEQKPFMDFIAASFISPPTLIAVGVTGLAWIAVYGTSIVRVAYKDRTRLLLRKVALQRRVNNLKSEVGGLNQRIAELKTQMAAPLPLTDSDPYVIPRYEKSPTAISGNGHPDWFVLNNDGRTEAYDVRIETIQCGNTYLIFPSIPLIKANTFGVARADLADVEVGMTEYKGIELAFQAAWSLNKEERDGNKLSRCAKMFYRDRNNNLFCTEFTAIYCTKTDFIEIENIRHSKIPDQSQVRAFHG